MTNPPKYSFILSANHLRAGAITHNFLTPTQAANLDPEAFLILAAEVQRVAQKITGAKAAEQLNLFNQFTNKGIEQ